MLWFHKHFFSCTLIVVLLFVVIVSYVRFMVLNDYVVAYEGDCDPYTESCFVGCEDEECTEEYYYSRIQKYAPHVEAQCGVDITDCDAAYECLPEDGSRCSISYCDPSIDGEDSCDLLTEADMETVIPDAGDYTADESELDVSEEGMDEADSEMGASLEEVISEEL